MKKYLSIICAMTMLAGFSGCSSSGGSSRSSDSGSSASEYIMSVETSKEYVERIGEQIEINELHEKYGELIGAIDGYAFHYNDLSFELYMFSKESKELEEAEKGVFTFTLEGFGEFTMTSKVNGNFVLLYDESEEDKAVIDAFYNVK